MPRTFQALATRALRVGLRLFPRDLRREYGEEMLAVFAERCRRVTVERGRLAGGLYVVWTLMDVIAQAARARVAVFLQPGWRDDVRYVVRSLRRSWGFTAAAIGILGVGLGVTTAVFAIFYAVLLRPFPYRSPETLVRIDWMVPSGQSQASSLRELETWRGGARTLAQIGAYSSATTDIRADGPADTVQVTYVSSETLAMLGVRPLVGRLFSAEQDVPTGDVHKAIISHELWTRLFNQRADVIGQLIRQGDGSLEIIGVMPFGFGFPSRSDLWVPIESMWARSTRAATQRLSVRSYAIVGRLADATAAESARQELQTLARAVLPERAEAALRVRTLQEAETGVLRPYLLALLGGVGCLALICITNVASLQLARAMARARELAVRAAIGASAVRNLRLQLLESLILATGGAIVAAAIAVAGLRLVSRTIPVPLPTWMRLEIDPWLLAGTLAIAAVASAIVSLLSARPALGAGSSTLLKSGRGTTDRSGLRKALVVSEIALSTVLLSTACLLIQTLLELQQREPGFRPDGVLAVQVSRDQVGTPEARARTLPVLHARVLERLSEIPGVVQVAATNRLPLAAGAGSRMMADLHVSGASGASATKASFFGSADVTPEYFATMGIPVLRGRSFTPHDHVDSARVVIVNERGASQLWPGEDAIGQQVTWGTPRPDNPPATVVGVVGNVRAFAAEGETGVDFYYPYAQYPVNTLFYMLRASVDPELLAQTVRQAVQSVEPTIAVSTIKAMPRLIDESLWQTRVWGWLFGLFAGTALLLAAAGLYALVSYLVALRAKEMSIRMSLGATGEQVTRMVLVGMLRLIAIGVIVGVGAALATSQLIGALLFQVSATDLRFHLATSAIVTTVALLACAPPIARSRRLDLSALFSGD